MLIFWITSLTKMFISIHRMYFTLRINLPHNNNQYWFLESTRKRNLLLWTLYYFQMHWKSWWFIDNCGGLVEKRLVGYQPTHGVVPIRQSQLLAFLLVYCNWDSLTKWPRFTEHYVVNIHRVFLYIFEYSDIWRCVFLRDLSIIIGLWGSSC